MYYTAKELVARAKQCDEYKSIPEDYWLCGIRMNEKDRKPNHFNCLTYLMRGEKIVMVTTATTVPGSPALLGGFRRYNKKGAAVIKANVFMNDGFSFGLHNSKMECLRQVKPFFTYRDGDKDNIAEQLGKASKGIYNTNFHGATYNRLSRLIRKYIGGYGYGCWVNNNNPEYVKIINLTKSQKYVSAIILEEFSI